MSRIEKKGFTLVEVIVVLTIVAIASATIVPSFTGYIDQSFNKKCAVELAAIQRQYKIERELAYNGGEEAINTEAYLKKAVEAYGGSYTGGMSFVGPCGTAGCKAIANENGTELISIKCPIHSGGVKPYDVGCATIETIITNKVFDEYFSTRKTGTPSLDSNGKNFAPKVNATLEELGFDQSSCEWRVSVNNQQDIMEIYWTDNCLDEATDGKYRFVKYTYVFSTKELISIDTGYCGVKSTTVEGKTFTVLNVGTNITEYDEVSGTAWSMD